MADIVIRVRSLPSPASPRVTPRSFPPLRLEAEFSTREAGEVAINHSFSSVTV